RGIVTVAADATTGNGGIGGLVADLQQAIEQAAFTVVSSPLTPEDVGTTRQLAPSDVTVRLNDGRLMLTGAYAMGIAAVAGGGAERLGFSQVAAAGATGGPVQSGRGYAIDAAQRGSIVNLGRADAPSGEITISG